MRATGSSAAPNEVELVELGEGRLESEIAAGGLELLHDVGGGAIEDALPGLDQGMTDAAEDMGFSCAGVADGDEVRAGLDPVSGSEGLDPCPGHARQSLEVEGGEGLATREPGLMEVALNAAGIPLGELEFGEGRQEASRVPAFGIGPLGERRPMPLEARQAQRREHGGQRMDVDGARIGGSGHAWPSRRASKLARSVSSTGVSFGSVRWRGARCCFRIPALGS